MTLSRPDANILAAALMRKVADLGRDVEEAEKMSKSHPKALHSEGSQLV